MWNSTVPDDRYLRDLRRYGLAIRMLRCAARPATVRLWTGFSRQRMRQVVRSYTQNRSESDPRCEPGPPPAALGKMLKNVLLRSELTAAAGLCHVLKLIPEARASNVRSIFPNVANGERVCRALEVYQKLVPHGQLTLEQLMVLVLALVEGTDWALERCVNCRKGLLIDPLSLERRICHECRDPTRGIAPARASLDPKAVVAIPEDTAPQDEASQQQSLF